MSLKIDKSGLEKLLQNARELDGTHEVKLVDIYTPSFVSAHSKFQDLEELFKASGFKIDNQEDLKAIPDLEWDEFIKNNTDFDNWGEMQHVALGEHVAAKLRRGI